VGYKKLCDSHKREIDIFNSILLFFMLLFCVFNHILFPYHIDICSKQTQKNIIFLQSFVAHQAQDWKIMQVINNKIRDDVIRKYSQYTKRVNGEMIKGIENRKSYL